jgi:hypothetical protein
MILAKINIFVLFNIFIIRHVITASQHSGYRMALPVPLTTVNRSFQRGASKERQNNDDFILTAFIFRLEST